MLNFDLNQNPPTAEEIAAERQEIERRLAAFKRKAGSISIFLIVAVAAALVAFWPLGDDFVVAITLAGVVFGVVFGACVCGCDEYGGRLSSLGDISPSDCDQLIADCLANSLCEAYRQKVAALGRKPVEAEVMMIRGWVAGADAREQERREGIACAMIASKEPLPSDADTVANREPTC
jgi:hypothetical protein